MFLKDQLAVDKMTSQQLFGRLQREVMEALSEAEWRNGCKDIVFSLHRAQAFMYELEQRSRQAVLF